MNKRLTTALEVATTILAGVAYSHVNANYIKRTHYALQCDHIKRHVRIAFISDLHYGNCQRKTAVDRMLVSLEKEDIDTLILGGDIVDSHTTGYEMRRILERLGSIPVRENKFYILGNHDSDDMDLRKHFTFNELHTTLRNNGIILLDNMSYVDNNLGICYIGLNCNQRKQQAATLMHSHYMCLSNYMVNIQHMPWRSKAEINEYHDLILSGHTHAGQLFPANILMKRAGFEPYGMYKNGDVMSIVTSGAGVSKIPFRNMKHCEYVIIDLFPMQ